MTIDYISYCKSHIYLGHSWLQLQPIVLDCLLVGHKLGVIASLVPNWTGTTRKVSFTYILPVSIIGLAVAICDAFINISVYFSFVYLPVSIVRQT